MTVVDHDEEESPTSIPASDTRIGPGTGRFHAVGLPTERSKNFGTVLRRLVSLFGPDRKTLIVVAIAAASSASLNVFGPRVLGHGTDIILQGVFHHRGIRF